MPRSKAWRTTSPSPEPSRLAPKETSDTRMPVRPSVAYRCTRGPVPVWAEAVSGNALRARPVNAPRWRNWRRPSRSSNPALVIDSCLLSTRSPDSGAHPDGPSQLLGYLAQGATPDRVRQSKPVPDGDTG